MNATVLSLTESICPVCLRQLPAQRVAEDDGVYLCKHCPEHGEFRTIVWRGLDGYAAWGAEHRPPALPGPHETEVSQGCPLDCGICAGHRQHSCCVLVEVTARCNLRCPVCFAAAGSHQADPPLADVRHILETLYARSPQVNVQLSGGEPTVRNDLPAIVALARAIGFGFVQVNTNGIRLGREAAYAAQLAQAGLDCVFLQFDTLDGATSRTIRGLDLVARKEAAIEHCRQAGLGVVLVPTLLPANMTEVGALIDFAARHTPTVRAIHFQPVSYFGRYPAAPADEDRITLPDVLRAIEAQTGGTVCAADFRPGSTENPYCSFSGSFFVDAGQRLRPNGNSTCGCGDGRTAQSVVARKWSAPAETGQSSSPCCATGINIVSLDAFLASRRRSLSISAMAFQDAWTLDLDRLRDCYIHVVGPDSRIIPFCAYNLTAQSGQPLYRARDGR
jgi:hypothetical protein